jgi:alcohol dehydrogenase class IV
MDLSLEELGVEKEMIDNLVRHASKSHLVRTNPRPASPEDMRKIYLKSL